MQRGEIWWADLPTPVASEPGYRRPVLIVQADEFNRSRIRTVIAVVLTTNLRLADAPGNILVTSDKTGLPQDSVINVSQVITVHKSFLTAQVSQLSDNVMLLVEDGLRLVLQL
ncbi:type II toxin-antitoxin system PemK/MazF family toxin [Aetokthonos hydrillicola Thurmond2011]|jgi:mRNA interferase MazF|uniref:mRNA interferase n=1 Tax=Aetokthonos hydrillicola Thurmond2011 TaxID=2712845 RepID=A0AAP5IAV5_9CYAN|nr:type II toxin-antitoxin system PemK/MazF family toxin [Aetokthonos hydrillicola]MBW4590776.1 type II toxin-antitoxin system PemK/MazF family toxin [Aetokthonos hydrillicola CCALA 1050]MDR9898036.1 type II toxin-antitoxin system PemK/MazF family toxin [Aetokthonos hydrillicola Thurmond2011]